MYSIVMKSVIRFFQWLMCMLLRVFQFMRIVFLAMVRAMRSNLEFIVLSVIIVRSPSKQREGDSGMRQPTIVDRDCVTSSQKCLIGVQCQVAWMYSMYL